MKIDSIWKFKKQFVIGLTLLTLITGWGGAAVMQGCFPAHYVPVFPYIPTFFFLWGILFITLFRRNAGRKITFLFLGIKVAKMLLFVLLTGLYVTLIGKQNLDFVMTFLIFYIIYLIFETAFFWKYEKRLKLNADNE